MVVLVLETRVLRGQVGRVSEHLVELVVVQVSVEPESLLGALLVLLLELLELLVDLERLLGGRGCG